MSKVLRVLVLSLLMVSWFSIANASAFRNGDQGEEITQLQTALANLGYDIVADGVFGSATKSAVIAFQTSRGLEADGLVGSATYRALMGRELPEVSRGGSYAARRIIQTSFQYIGVPYVFGGTTPSGFDCSGFVRYVFANAGIWLPRTADEQYETGYSVANLQPGDLVFFSTYTAGPSHSGIYIGNGNFISATSSSGVKVDNLYSGYWGSCYIGARRVL
ncbi:C40 family peptidase [Anaerosinus massiliensis]|uniref:C40 family peptidase n=1 Tax=Massilibacillus massiliensis TaxID=1806837 RepID=UPI000B0B4AFA|nr:NlpC/P60 family protein [Massilibacillus massiliensis]